MRKWAGVIFVVFLGLVAGCLVQDTTADRPLRIGWYRWPGWYPMAIAQDQGFFARKGVNVVPVLYDDYAHVLVDLASGKIDGCCCGLYEALRSGLPDLGIVLVTDHSDGAEGLVVSPDIHDPRDLVGKRIGMQQSSSGAEFLVSDMLLRHGLSLADLTVVDLDLKDIVAEMPGNIQAGYTWEPYLAEARDKGYRLLFSTADAPGMIVDVVAFNGRVLRARGDDVRAFIAVWFEAVALWSDGSRTAAESIERIVGEKTSGERTGYHVLDLDANIRAFQDADSSLSLHQAGTRQVEFLVKRGYLSARPDLWRMLDGSFLPTREGQP